MPVGPAWLSLPTWSDLQRRWWPGLVALLAANLVPVVGVLAFQWDLGFLMLLYWIESAIILLFSLIKVAMATGAAAVGLIPFFLIHAGIFMGAHLLFLVGVFTGLPDADGWRELGIAAAGLFVSHLVSFLVNVVRNKERPKSAALAMGGFYARIVVMQLTIIFGAMLVGVLGDPVWALVLLVVLKTGVDAGAHLRERLKNALLRTPQGADVVTPDAHLPTPTDPTLR